MSADPEFEDLVKFYYPDLYRFGLSLTGSEADACDLAQETFYIWANKRHQLKDPTKVKAWLFTTLHREFLEKRRRQIRFPHFELNQIDGELPSISPEMVNQLDSRTVLQALARVDASYQAALALFYLEDHSYKEIAEILEIPLGTVKSRLSRGIVQLQQILACPHITPVALKKEHHG